MTTLIRWLAATTVAALLVPASATAAFAAKPGNVGPGATTISTSHRVAPSLSTSDGLLPGDRWGYVWADQPTVAAYTPSTLYQSNSTGALNTITRSGVGNYTVRFTSLGAGSTPTGGGGTVSVSAYGGGSAMCKVAFWNPAGAHLDAAVRCYTATGSPTDSLFTASFTATLNNPGDFGFAWANQPSSTLSVPYTPSLFYQFNSKGRTNQVTRFSPGRYAVFMPGLGGSTVGGTVLVSGYGSDSSTCIATDWFSTGGDLEIDVQCRPASGSPQADAFFVVTYARNTSTLGVVGAPIGYVLADQPSTASYTPSVPHQFNSTGGTNTVTRSSVGNYTVLLPGLGVNNGHVEVSASGFGAERCKVGFWFASGTALSVNVLCFAASGAAQDARFTMSYTR